MIMDAFLNFTVRAVVGLFLGMLFGIFGFFTAWIFFPQNHAAQAVEIIPFMVTGSGIGAAAGGLVAWFRRDVSRGYAIGTVVMAIVGGVGGSWAGFQYGRWVYDDIIVYSGPTRGAALAAASLSTNVLLLVYQLILDRRARQRQGSVPIRDIR